MNHFKYLFLLSILCSLIFFSNCCRNCEYTQVNPDGSVSFTESGNKFCLLPNKDCEFPIDPLDNVPFEMTDCSCGKIKDINIPIDITNEELLENYRFHTLVDIPNFSDCISLSEDYFFGEFSTPCILTDTSHVNLAQYSSIVMNNCSMNLIRICGWNDCHSYGDFICLDDRW